MKIFKKKNQSNSELKKIITCVQMQILSEGIMYACFPRLRSDINCLHLEVFSFKRHPARLDCLDQCNYFIFLQWVYIKVILPGVSWWAPLSYLCHCNCDWLNHTMWSNGSCRRIPRGMVAVILFPADQVMCDWLNHTTWFHSNPELPCSMGFETILFHFLTQYRRQYAM